VNGTAQTVRKYYSLAGSTFAMSDNGAMKYLLSDHLGSTVAVTDAAGILLEQSRYMPFGEVRGDVGGVTSTDKTYTGQKSIPETGLMDYKARMYDPLLGRFIQPDNIIANAVSSANFNRYSYVFNNPILYTDPTGHITCAERDKNGRCVKDEDWIKKKSTSDEREQNIINSIGRTNDACYKDENISNYYRFSVSSVCHNTNLQQKILPLDSKVLPNLSDLVSQGPLSDLQIHKDYNYPSIYASNVLDATGTFLDLVSLYKEIPGGNYIGVSLNFIAQWDRDTRSGVPIEQKLLKSSTVAFEQLGIGIVSTTAATDVAAGSSETLVGPIVAIGIYFEINGFMSYLANELNNQIIFPAISNINN
jgi:RHS repeat-associated protein